MSNGIENPIVCRDEHSSDKEIHSRVEFTSIHFVRQSENKNSQVFTRIHKFSRVFTLSAKMKLGIHKRIFPSKWAFLIGPISRKLAPFSSVSLLVLSRRLGTQQQQQWRLLQQSHSNQPEFGDENERTI